MTVSEAFHTTPTHPPAWTRDYIGLPWVEKGRDRGGCDCWGLLRLVLAEQFNVEVPNYDGSYEDVDDCAELATLIAGGMGPWRDIWKPEIGAGAAGAAAAARDGDGLLFRMMGHPCHVGVVVATGWMLHVREGTASALERFDGMAWSRRLVGIYRWVGSLE